MLDLVCYFLRLHIKLPQIYRLKTTLVYYLSVCGSEVWACSMEFSVRSHKAKIKVWVSLVPHLEALGKIPLQVVGQMQFLWL